jgi:hypothetical protein
MSASYPASVKGFTPLVDGINYPQAADVNQAYDEITAVEQALITDGLAHDLDPDATANGRDLGSTTKQWDQIHGKLLNLADASELTVATGAITVTQSYHKVDTEADAASDDLDTITAGSGLGAGAVVVLRAENVARVVTVKDATGNILLGGDLALSATDRTLTLIYDGTNWREIARSGASATPVAFPATQAASADANTLDDYEEGTFTPGLSFGGGTTGLTYTTQTGHYAKIGKNIFWTAFITISAVGSSTGAAKMTGLPVADGDSVGRAVTVGAYAAFTGLTGGLGANHDSGATTVSLSQRGSSHSTGTTNVTHAVFTATSSLSLSGWYRAAD